jgi:mannosyltransferase OCH1-like enzyme
MRNTKIPRRIYTIWLGPKDPPPLVDYCIDSHCDVPGFEHEYITTNYCPRGIPYLDRCLKLGKWVKAADYLRMYLLYTNGGGIYLDADIEVRRPEVLVKLVNQIDASPTLSLVCARETNGFISNAFIAATKAQPDIGQWLERANREYIADNDEVWNYGMGAWTHQFYDKCNAKDPSICIQEPNTMLIDAGDINDVPKENICMIHHFLRSWVQIPGQKNNANNPPPN